MAKIYRYKRINQSTPIGLILILGLIVSIIGAAINRYFLIILLVLLLSIYVRILIIKSSSHIEIVEDLIIKKFITITYWSLPIKSIRELGSLKDFWHGIGETYRIGFKLKTENKVYPIYHDLENSSDFVSEIKLINPDIIDRSSESVFK